MIGARVFVASLSSALVSSRILLSRLVRRSTNASVPSASTASGYAVESSCSVGLRAISLLLARCDLQRANVHPDRTAAVRATRHAAVATDRLGLLWIAHEDHALEVPHALLRLECQRVQARQLAAASIGSRKRDRLMPAHQNLRSSVPHLALERPQASLLGVACALLLDSNEPGAQGFPFDAQGRLVAARGKPWAPGSLLSKRSAQATPKR